LKSSDDARHGGMMCLRKCSSGSANQFSR